MAQGVNASLNNSAKKKKKGGKSKDGQIIRSEVFEKLK
jgi:hypothetical protein